MKPENFVKFTSYGIRIKKKKKKKIHFDITSKLVENDVFLNALSLITSVPFILF